MTGFRTGHAIALASSLLACASGAPGMRRHFMPPPARESRVGASERSAGPAPGYEALASASRPAPRPGDGDVARAIEAASSLVGRRTIVLDGVDYGSSCTALVRAAFAHAGHPLPPTARDAASVFTYAREHGALTRSRQPSAGDLVFLADRPGGPPEHVGIVARADPDGTALVLHRVARGVLHVRMNLAYPSRPTDPATGKHINDTLIVNAHGVTAGSLVVGVSDLLRHG
jgi:cell wall-associated NlpC family hydrolase